MRHFNFHRQQMTDSLSFVVYDYQKKAYQFEILSERLFLYLLVGKIILSNATKTT